MNRRRHTEGPIRASRATVDHRSCDGLSTPSDRERLPTVATIVVVIELLGHRDNHVIGIVGPPAVSCKDE